MAIAHELNQSDAGRQDTDRRREFYITGAATIDEAYAAIVGHVNAPATLGGLVRQKPYAESLPGRSNEWFGYVDYAPQDVSPFDVEESELAIDMNSGTVLVTMAKQHMADYAASGYGTANHNGAINVKRSASGGIEVEGVELPMPSMTFQLTRYVRASDMTQTYIESLYKLRGGTNNATWTVSPTNGEPITFAAGEVIYLGCSAASQGKTGKWAVTLHFRAEPNLTNATIGPFTGVNKKGSDYIWFEFVDQEDDAAMRLVAGPAYAHVEKVCHDVDFSLLEPA